MIGKGSRVVLRTSDAIYSTCRIVSMSKDTVTVTYYAGLKKDPKTKRRLFLARILSACLKGINMLIELPDTQVLNLDHITLIPVIDGDNEVKLDITGGNKLCTTADVARKI